MSTQLPKVLITGASSGIGATYADRFARRGHDLVLVARDETRMRMLAERLQQGTRAAIQVLKADLTSPANLARVEALAREAFEAARRAMLPNFANAHAAERYSQAQR